MLLNAVKNYKNKPITITKEAINCIREHKADLVNVGVIKTVDFPNQCIQCGKDSDIWLTVLDDGSTAMCLDCTEGVTLDSSIEINCLKDGCSKMKCF